MDPDTRLPQQPPSRNGGSNPYDFLTEPPPKQPAVSSLLGGRSKKARILIAALGGALLILIASVVIGLLNSVEQADTANLVSAARQQNELIRLAGIGADKSRSQRAKNLAVTTQLTLQSQQAAMINAVKIKNKQFSTKDLSTAASKRHDELLTAAEQSNRFDEEFLDIIQKGLAEYQQTLEKAYKGAEGPKLKTALASQYESANILVGAPAPQPEQ